MSKRVMAIEIKKEFSSLIRKEGTKVSESTKRTLDYFKTKNAVSQK